MRILHINTNYINNPLHQNMIDSLNDANVENQVLVPTCDAKNSVIKPKEYVTLCECFSKCDRINYYKKQKKIFSAVKSVCDINAYDCIHAYTVFTDGNVAYNLNKEYGIPYVVAVRNTDINTFFKYMIHLRKRGIEILKNASAIFFLSESYKNILFSNYVKPEDYELLNSKTYIIPNGIDKFWLCNISNDKKKCDKNDLRICFAGKIDKNKNCELTVKACDLLVSEGYKVTYTVVGNIINKKFNKMIQSKNYIKHIPYLKKEDLLKIYRQNHIFVMPSLTESFGMVYLEAMSQGLPVIYTKGEGFDNQFEEGLVGYHASPYDETEVADALKSVVDNYEQISLNCRYSLLNYTWEQISNTYSNIYNEIIMR